MCLALPQDQWTGSEWTNACLWELQLGAGASLQGSRVKVVGNSTATGTRVNTSHISTGLNA